MLKMDQILASNELTIAATAAMPAFAIFGEYFRYIPMDVDGDNTAAT